MKMELIYDEIEQIIYEIKQAISNISLDHYEDSLYCLLNSLDSIYSLKNIISKENS